MSALSAVHSNTSNASLDVKLKLTKVKDVNAPEAPPTLADIAARAGVSIAAVSLALRGKSGVAADTRKRVMEHAAELGYRGRTGAGADADVTIGLLLKSRPGDQGNVNAFYGPVVAGITEAARTAGVDVLLDALPVDVDYRPIEIPKLVTAGTTSGLIVLGASLTAETSTALGSQPIVLVDGYTAEPERHVSIVTDNLAGADAATSYLIDRGHRHVALVGTTPDAFPSIQERRSGYLTAMRRSGLQVRCIDHHYEQARDCADLLVAAIRADPTLTAAFCANDTVALACLAQVRAAGVDVPGEFSIVGFDDLDAAALVSPGLDTMAIDKSAMGRLAVRLLRHQLEWPTDPPIVAMQRPHLVRRHSVADLSAS